MSEQQDTGGPALNKDERSLLLFLETQAVDRGAIVAGVHMNNEDFETARRWDKERFVRFGRMPLKSIINLGSRERGTHWVILGEQAWAKAQELREAKAKRTINPTAAAMLAERKREKEDD